MPVDVVAAQQSFTLQKRSLDMDAVAVGGHVSGQPTSLLREARWCQTRSWDVRLFDCSAGEIAHEVLPGTDEVSP